MSGNFEAWMSRVDSVLERRIGLSSQDLSDCCYRDWYDCGMTPSEAATEVLQENGI